MDNLEASKILEDVGNKLYAVSLKREAAILLTVAGVICGEDAGIQTLYNFCEGYAEHALNTPAMSDAEKHEHDLRGLYG